LYTPVAKPTSNSSIAVGLGAGKSLRALARPTNRALYLHTIHDRFQELGFVSLPGSDHHVQGNSIAIGQKVELRSEPSTRIAECVVRRFLGAPFFPPPAAARDARTEAPSMHHRSQSIRPCRSISSRIEMKIRFSVSSERHRLKRS
jgi:hypothetical protein